MTNAKLCFIVNQYRQPVVSIITLRFGEETVEQVKRHLDKALATLPFRTLYSYVIFNTTDAAGELLREAVVEEVVDSPGAPSVTLKLAATCGRPFFLPRDPETGEFINIAAQTQCLSVLRAAQETT